MTRGILIAVIALLFIAGVVYLYVNFQQLKQPVNNAYHAVPSSAALIVECNDPNGLWKKLSETNIMWEELLVTEYFNGLDKDMRTFQLVLSNYPRLQKIINEQPVIVSVHMSGAWSFDFLFLMSLPATNDISALVALPKKLAEKLTTTSEKSYDGVTITTINASASSPQAAKESTNNFSYAFHEGIFIGSYNTILVEEAIRQLNSASQVITDGGLKQVMATAGKRMDANIFLNHRVFPNLVSTFLTPEYAESFNNLNDLADWMEIDLKLKPNYFILNGFTYSNDTLNNYLNIFRGQEPQDADVVRIIPYNTASIIHLGFSDFQRYHQNLKDYLERNNALFDYEMLINQINGEYDCVLEEQILSWIGSEVALVTLEPPTPDLIRSSYLILRANDIDEADHQLGLLLEQVALKTEQPIDSTIFRDHLVRQINIADLFETLFGPAFSKLKYNYFTIIEDYVVFGNSFNSMRDFITDHLSEKTLAKDLHYDLFSENLSSESNIFIYSNIARSTNIYKAFMASEHLAAIDEQLELFQKFEAVAIQISKDKGDLFYNNIFLKHNPVYKKETTSLWEATLDTSISMKPFLHSNHYTGAKEIFVQDDANNIYLISNTGKVLWKRKLDEPIMSQVQQVDAFKNAKLQMVFNTASKLHMIDRNGKDVGDFPIELPAKASASLAVMDYDKRRDYRFLVPCVDKYIYNYDRSGKPVRGWEYTATTSPIVSDIKHFDVKRKDLVIAIDSVGTVKVLDRKGRDRMSLLTKLPVMARNGFYIDKQKTIRTSSILTTDSTGVIHRLFFSDKLDTTFVNDFSADHFYIYADLNADGQPDHIFADDTEVVVYDQDKSEMMRFILDSAATAPPTLFTFNNSTEIGIVSGKTNELYLINELGYIHDGLPLYGSTAFSIGDINRDGTLNLVVGSGDRIVFTYNVE